MGKIQVIKQKSVAFVTSKRGTQLIIQEYEFRSQTKSKINTKKKGETQ